MTGVCGFACLHGEHSPYDRVRAHTSKRCIHGVLAAESTPPVSSKATNSALYSDMILWSGDYCRVRLMAPFTWSRPSVSWTLLFLAWRHLGKDGCDFLSIATLSFHLFYSCTRTHISAIPMNTRNCEFSLVLQVCFMGRVQLCWSALGYLS